MTIRTKEKLRYNLDIDLKDIEIIEEPSTNKVLKLEVVEGKIRNVFDIKAYSTKAIPYLEEKWIKIRVKSIDLDRKIRVFI